MEDKDLFTKLQTPLLSREQSAVSGTYGVRISDDADQRKQNLVRAKVNGTWMLVDVSSVVTTPGMDDQTKQKLERGLSR